MRVLALREAVLYLETAHAGHVEVENDAVGLAAREILEHGAAGSECPGFDPRGSEEPLERPAHGFLVIDNGDERFLAVHELLA